MGLTSFAKPGQQKAGGRDTLTPRKTAAATEKERQSEQRGSEEKLFVPFHGGTIGWNVVMATLNSTRSRRLSGAALSPMVALLLLLDLSAAADLKEAELRYQAARRAWETNSLNLETSWKFAEACFDRGEHATTNNKERAALAEQGIAAAREVVRRSSNSVPGRFFLALNLGQLARTRTFSALGLVSEMEQHFLVAVVIDPGFHNAAPERSLGMLYWNAPGWPTSIGSRNKARAHLQKAVGLAPDYPENLLTLLEAEWKWSERAKVIARLPELDSLFQKGKEKFKGSEWTESWTEWRDRLEKLRKQIQQHPVVSAPSPLRRSP